MGKPSFSKLRIPDSQLGFPLHLRLSRTLNSRTAAEVEANPPKAVHTKVRT